MNKWAVLIAFFALWACAPKPEPIRWGVDTCDQCRMVLVDKRFAAEFVASRGRIYKFDGVDEMGLFQRAHRLEGVAYVVDGESGNLILADMAAFLFSPSLQSPMGGHVMTFSSLDEARRYAAEHRLGQPEFLSYARAVEKALGGGDGGR